MGLLSKPIRWVKKQTHGGLSMDGLKSSVKGAAKNPLTYAALLPFAAPALGALGGVAAKGAAMIPGAGKVMGAAGWLKDKMGGGSDDGDGWGLDGGDILSALGAGVGGYMDAEQAARALAEQRRQFDSGLGQRQSEAATAADQWAQQFGETQRVGDRNFLEDQTRFNRTQGNTEAQLAVQAETALNRAPMADKAQALLLSRMGVTPERFQPRDITRGVDQFRQGPSGGMGNVQAASAKAAQGYKPGQGGVDTTALKLLQQRMLASSKPATATVSRERVVAPRPAAPQRLTAPRPTLMLPASTEPDPQDLLRRAPAMGVARRPMAFR